MMVLAHSGRVRIGVVVGKVGESMFLPAHRQTLRGGLWQAKIWGRRDLWDEMMEREGLDPNGDLDFMLDGMTVDEVREANLGRGMRCSS